MKKIQIVVLAVVIIAASAIAGSFAFNGSEIFPTFLDDKKSDLRAVKIGMILPLTGDFSSYGSESMEAALYGIDQFNKYLESTDQDWYLDPVVEDTATNPVQALEKIQNLRAKNIELVLGYTSGSLNAVQSYANSNGVMVFSAASTAPSLAIPDDNIFRLTSDDRQQAKALASLLKNQGIKVAVTVWRADTYGDGLSENFKTSFANDGGIADEGIRYNQESLEFSVDADILNSRVISLIDEHGADNVGIVFIGFAETVQFMQSASQYDALKNIKWFGSDSISQERKIIDDTIAGQFAEDISLTTTIVGFPSTPTSEMLDAHIVETLGRIPTTFAKTAYDIIWLYGLAISESGSDRSSDVLPIMHKIASEYSGAIGPTILNENGDLASGDYTIHAVSDGDWVYRGTYYRNGTIILDGDQTEMDKIMAIKGLLSGPVKIGLLSPISGSLSGYGEETRVGSIYGAEKFNEYLKSIGEDWYMEIISEDTATNPVQALEKIQILNAKNIQLVMGSTTSASASNIKQYVDNNGMLLFACCSSAPSLAISGDSIYRLAPDDRNQAKALAAIMKDRGVEAYVPIWRGDPYGDGINDNLPTYFENSSQLKEKGIRYSPEIRDFSVESSVLANRVSELVAEYGKDKVAVVLTGFEESLQLVQSANSYEILRDVQWFGTNSLTHSSIFQNDPIATDFVQDVNFTALIVKPESTSIGDEVTQHVVEKIGRNASMFVLSSYDISWIYGTAILQAQSDRASDIKPILEQVVSEYTGALGTINLNEYGDVESADYVISTIIDANWVDVGVYRMDGNLVWYP